MNYQYIITYPICHGKMINFAAFSLRHDLENTSFDEPWTSTTDTSEFAQAFYGWDSEVQALIEVCPWRLYLRAQRLTNHDITSALRNRSAGQYTP
jgi:hypothetical protein